MQKIVHESLRTLQAQVDALVAGRNPVVYFPPGTKESPVQPFEARSVFIAGDAEGCGTYYFHPSYTSESRIRSAVEHGCHGKLLGFVQSKEEVVAGLPKALVARDRNGMELKAAAVDGRNIVAVIRQKFIFDFQFPGATVALEDIQNVVRERAAL